MGKIEEKSEKNVPIWASQSIDSIQKIVESQPIETSQSVDVSSSAGVDISANGDRVSSEIEMGVSKNINISVQQPVGDNYITKPRKSMFIAMILSFLFGPLGMLYTSVKHALILIGVCIITAIVTGGISGIIFWIISMIWTYIDVKKLNKG